jgi:hypothetical protein
MRHARLTGLQQVVACLNLINEAFRRVRGDDGVLCGLDERGYCFIAQETRRSIARVWESAIASRNMTLPMVPAQAQSEDSTSAPASAAAFMPSNQIWTARPHLGESAEGERPAAAQ